MTDVLVPAAIVAGGLLAGALVARWLVRAAPRWDAALDEKTRRLVCRLCVRSLVASWPADPDPETSSWRPYMAGALMRRWLREAPWHVTMLSTQPERARQEFLTWAQAEFMRCAQDEFSAEVAWLREETEKAGGGGSLID